MGSVQNGGEKKYQVLAQVSGLISPSGNKPPFIFHSGKEENKKREYRTNKHSLYPMGLIVRTRKGR